MHRMVIALVASVALLAGALGVAGCGEDENATGPAKFGKTRIAVNLGLTAVLGGVTAALQDGKVDVQDLVGAGTDVDQLLDVGKTLGLDVKERTPPGLS